LFLQPGGQALLAERRHRHGFAGALNEMIEQGILSGVSGFRKVTSVAAASVPA
jgi:hypothetical protein